MNGRLAIIHWAFRLLRREWRQHSLVIGLVSFGIFASVMVVSTLVRTVTPLERETAGALSVTTIQTNDADRETQKILMSRIEEIVNSHNGLEIVTRTPEDNQGIRLIGQDPNKPLGKPWLQLREGKWPEPGEITLSERAVKRLQANGDNAIAEVGRKLNIFGSDKKIVGHYENPTDLDDSSGIVPIGEAQPWLTLEVLLPTRQHPATTELLSLFSNSDSDPSKVAIYTQDRFTSSNQKESVTFGYAIGTVLLIQITMLASAGFGVIASRRRRQLGILSALGAEPRTVSFVMKVTGLLVGLFGGLLGLGVGVALSVAITPLLQNQLDFRVSRLAIGWPYLLPMVPLAVVAAVGAAWWPSRQVRSKSPIEALSKQPSLQTGYLKGFGVGVLMLTSGIWLMKVGAPKNDALTIITSVLLITVGALSMSPTAAAMLGQIAKAAPMPIRIAWRDIARKRSRSAAAIGAASIAIAIPFGVASFTNSLSHTWVPSVPNNIVEVSSSPQTAQSINSLLNIPDNVAALASALPGSRIAPIAKLTDPDAVDAASLAAQNTADVDVADIPYYVKGTRRNGSEIWLRTALATPELLSVMGVESPPSNVDMIVWSTGRLHLDPALVVERRTDNLPESFPEALVMKPFSQLSIDKIIVDTWYVVADHPLTQADRDRILFASQISNSENGNFADSRPQLRVSFANNPPWFVAIRTIAMTIGGLIMLTAIAVVATLIRVENADDLRVLNAIGARPRTMRTISGATVASLAFASSVIAVIAAFGLLAGVYLNPDENYVFVIPWVELCAVFVAIPLIGGVVAWCLTPTREFRISPRSM